MVDDGPRDAELGEWLSQINQIQSGWLRTSGRLDEWLASWQHTIRALQAARECIAELETEIADMRGNVRKIRGVLVSDHKGN